MVITITLDTLDKVKEFVGLVATFNGDLDIISDRYVVDAKSIMGILSLDLSKPLKLSIHNEEEAKLISEKLANFIV